MFRFDEILSRPHLCRFMWFKMNFTLNDLRNCVVVVNVVQQDGSMIEQAVECSCSAIKAGRKHKSC